MPLKDGSYKGPHWATRRAVLEMLKTRGGLSAGEMAADLGVSAMAVRQHLVELEASGDVASRDESRGVGRPTKVWELTALAERHFPDRHRDLILELLEGMRRTLGQEAVDRLIEQRGEEQAVAYARRIKPGLSLRKRVELLAEIRSEEGYMAESLDEGKGVWLLAENHCPICAAAEKCAGLCAAELSVFRKVLGEKVQVEQVEHALSGSNRCAYRIRKL